MKRRFSGPKVLGIIMVVLLAIAAFSFLVMTLWNSILVPVLKISAVSFWQAGGILLLSKILFGGFRGGGPWRGGRHMRDKWQQLSPEERERLKTEWRNRCQGSKWRSSTPEDIPPTGKEGND